MDQWTPWLHVQSIPWDPTLTALDPGSTSRPGPIQVPLKEGKKRNQTLWEKDIRARMDAPWKSTLFSCSCFGIPIFFCIFQTLHLWSFEHRAQHCQDEFASVRIPPNRKYGKKGIGIVRLLSNFIFRICKETLSLFCKGDEAAKHVEEPAVSIGMECQWQPTLLPVKLFDIAIFWDGPIDRRQRSLPCPDTWDSWPFKLRVFCLFHKMRLCSHIDRASWVWIRLLEEFTDTERSEFYKDSSLRS